MNQGRLGILLFAFVISVILAVLVALSIKAFARERKLKNFMGRRNREVTWHDKMLEFSRQFTRVRHDELQQKLVAAGLYDERFVIFYFPFKYGLFGCVALLLLLLRDELGLTDPLQLLSAVAGAAIFFILVPDIYLNQRKTQLTRRISGNLPYLIDLLGVCVQTGMTIEAAFIYITKEVAGFDRDLAFMIKKTTDRSKIIGLHRALEELLERVPSNEMRSFVNTINQSLQYGTSIYNVLLTLSKDIRELQMLELEEKVGKLSAKMSIPLILFIMLPIVILVAGPGVMRLFLYGFQ